MNRFVFVSGWAGYTPLYPHLAQACDCLVPFVEHTPEAVLDRLRQGGDMLVGWSTGAHMVLAHREEIFSRFRRVVLVAPFLNFCVHVDRQVVEVMRDTIREEGPERTVRAFWRNCGLKKSPMDVPLDDGEALAQGLQYLLDSSIVPAEQEQGANVRVIHGAGDKVVPVAAGSEISSILSGSWFSIMDAGHYVPEETLLGILHEETGSDVFQSSR